MKTNDSVLAAIRAHAEAAYPEECCGFLLGTLASDECTVRSTYQVQNLSEKSRSRHYTITPDDYQRAGRKAAQEGLDIVGFYHSHPDHPAQPSRTDLAEATFPGYRYVIVSVQNGRSAEFTAWRLRPDRSEFINEPMTTEFIPTETATI